MDKEAADSFIAWLQGHEEQLAAINQEVLNAQENGISPKKIAKIYDKLSQQLSPHLYEICEGLSFEIGPGEGAKHCLIFTASGISDRIEAVRYLCANLQELSHWEVIAFKPARAITDAVNVTFLLPSGTKEIVATDVKVSCTSEINRVGVTLYFPDYKDEDYRSWAEIGFNFLDFSLGEYTVMQSVGEVEFASLTDAPEDALSLPELHSHFPKVVNQLKDRFNALAQQDAAAHIKTSLELLSESVAHIQESLESSQGEQEVGINLFLWTDNEQAPAGLSAALPHFDMEVAPKLSALGEGYEIALCGTLPTEVEDIKSWLRDTLNAVPATLLIVDIFEEEALSTAVAEFTTAYLIEHEQYDDAITILKQTIQRSTEDVENLYLLLIMAYDKTDNCQAMLETCEIALENTRDEEVRGELLNNTGCAYQRLGDIDQAITFFEQAVALDDCNSNRLYNLGQAYANKAMLKEALEYLGRALDIAPGLRELMEQDPDIEPIRNSTAFKEMLDEKGKPRGLLHKLIQWH